MSQVKDKKLHKNPLSKESSDPGAGDNTRELIKGHGSW